MLKGIERRQLSKKRRFLEAKIKLFQNQVFQLVAADIIKSVSNGLYTESLTTKEIVSVLTTYKKEYASITKKLEHPKVKQIDLEDSIQEIKNERKHNS